MLRRTLFFLPIGSHLVRCVSSTSSAQAYPRLKVVMDLDECMVHSFIPAEIEYRQYEDRPNVGKVIPGIETIQVKCEDGLLVYMHLRPHLRTFLKSISSFADIYGYTAGLNVYGRPAFKCLYPEDPQLFHNVWYRHECVEIRTKKGTFYGKNLAKVLALDYDPARTVLVDNNILSFYPQPDNAVMVPEFVGDAKDVALLQVADFLKALNDKSDVRPHLRNIFQIETQLKKMLEVDSL